MQRDFDPKDFDPKDFDPKECNAKQFDPKGFVLFYSDAKGLLSQGLDN